MDRISTAGVSSQVGLYAARPLRNTATAALEGPRDQFTPSAPLEHQPINFSKMLGFAKNGQATVASEPQKKRDCSEFSCHRRPGELGTAPTREEALDQVQAMIDAASLIPVLSTPLSLVNALISAARGDVKGALLNVACAIPVVGIAGKAGLIVKGVALASHAGAAAKMGAAAGAGVKYASSMGLMTNMRLIPGFGLAAKPGVLEAAEQILKDKAARKGLDSAEEANQFMNRIRHSGPADTVGTKTLDGAGGGNLSQQGGGQRHTGNPYWDNSAFDIKLLGNKLKNAEALIKRIQQGDDLSMQLAERALKSSHCEGFQAWEWTKVQNAASSLLNSKHRAKFGRQP